MNAGAHNQPVDPFSINEPYVANIGLTCNSSVLIISKSLALIAAINFINKCASQSDSNWTNVTVITITATT